MPQELRVNKKMIELTVKAEDVNELIVYWSKLGNLIREGFTSGTLMDGWDITDIEQVY